MKINTPFPGDEHPVLSAELPFPVVIVRLPEGHLGCLGTDDMERYLFVLMHVYPMEEHVSHLLYIVGIYKHAQILSRTLHNDSTLA